MKYEEIKVGEYYKLSDYYGYKGPALIYILGRDPFNEGKYAISSKEWDGRVSHLNDEDFEYLEKI